MTFTVAKLSMANGNRIVTREKYRSKCDYFQVVLGGIWTYHAPCSWECDDGLRTIHRCAASLDMFDDPIGPSQCYLYTEGKPTQLLDDAIRAARPKELSDVH